MKRCAVLTIALGIACTMAACGGVSDKTCTSNADCVEGLVCDNTGKCVEREPLAIVTKSLPDATVGVPYRVTLQAAGGIPEYTWTLAYGPEWIDGIGASSGELSGTPDAPGSDLAVGIEVTDKSAAGGQSVTAQLLISVFACVDGATQPCYRAEAGQCFQSLQHCTDGEWDECTGGDHSYENEHCGPDCGPCDMAVSSGCSMGVCVCGNGSICGAGQACCGGHCTDAMSDDLNCGTCGTACEDDVDNAVNPHCEQGRCDYDVCDPEYLDADGDRSNGCELARDLENCRYAGEPCEAVVQNATGLSCVEDPDDGYLCAYEACDLGFLDCDGNTHNGCELAVSNEDCTACLADCGDAPAGNECVLVQDDQQQDMYRCGCNTAVDCEHLQGDYQCCDNTCVLRNADDHCGDCQTDCTDSPQGPTCVDEYNHTCGCLDVGECEGLGDLCCDQTCIPIDLDNCGFCGRVCDPFDDGGPVCDLDGGLCYCEDDAQCNDFAGSVNHCEGQGTAAACICTKEGLPCLGGTGSQCCAPQGGDPICVNLVDDPANCGRCGVHCAGGQSCVQGRCQCSNGFPDPIACPQTGPAPNCGGSLCTCDHNPAGDQPCAEGRMCCNGTDGGTGGPGGGADEGCCWNPCGDNAPGDCLY